MIFSDINITPPVVVLSDLAQSAEALGVGVSLRSFDQPLKPRFEDLSERLAVRTKMRRYAAHGDDSIYVDLQKDYFLGSAYLAQARQMKRAHATVSVRNPAKKIEEVFKSNRLSFYVWSVYYKTNIFFLYSQRISKERHVPIFSQPSST